MEEPEYLGYLPIGDLDYLKELLDSCKKSKGKVSLEKLLESFFSLALVPFYDPMWDGLKTHAGHVIYRLSDSVPEEKRRNIAIYPANNGSLIMDKYPWASLEDWRAEWQKYHKQIPGDDIKQLVKMIMPADSFILKKDDQA